MLEPDTTTASIRTRDVLRSIRLPFKRMATLYFVSFLALDFAFGQCFLKLLHAFVGHFGGLSPDHEVDSILRRRLSRSFQCLFNRLLHFVAIIPPINHLACLVDDK